MPKILIFIRRKLIRKAHYEKNENWEPETKLLKQLQEGENNGKSTNTVW
jgi:hypothetical protein